MFTKTRNIKLAYIVTFVTIIMLLVGVQVIVELGFNKYSVNQSLLNISTEESLVSQKVTQNSVFIYLKKDDTRQVRYYKDRLKRLLAQWEKINYGLQNENGPVSQTYPEGVALEGMFHKIAPFYLKIVEEAELLSEKPDHLESQQSVETILMNQEFFLDAIADFIFQHQKDMKGTVNGLKVIKGLLGGAILFLLLFGFIFIFGPTFRRPGPLHQQFLFGLDKSKVEQEKQKEKMKLLAILQGEEQERGRISMELHDGVGQWLTAMKIHLKAWEKQTSQKIEKPGQDLIGKLSDLLDGANNEIKRISNNLTPKLLNDFGLTEAIRNLTYTIFGETQVKTDLNILLGEKRYSSQIESFLFRMVQEILNNISKHAGANRVKLDLHEKQGNLFLNVTDDGKGFDPDHQGLKSKNTSGLMNLKRRVQLLNGDFNINTAIGKGCEVLIKIPVHQNAKD